MKKITRKQVSAWLSPMRRSLLEMRSGYCDSIDDRAVTKLHNQDDYARVDYCVAGFRGLISRLFPKADVTPLLLIEEDLANSEPLTVAEIAAALAMLRAMEKPLMGKTVQEVKGAVLDEQIAIELDAMREAA